MPRLPINFSLTIIYKLVCNDVNIKDIYVGATTNFKVRKNTHKTKCINPNNKRKVYSFIRENGNWDNWNMIMIEEYKTCKNQLESDTRERYWLETLKATLNMVIPSQKKNEYYKIFYETNKQEIIEKVKEYRNNNKEKIKEIKSEKITCICGSICRKGEIFRHNKTKKHIKYIQ